MEGLGYAFLFRSYQAGLGKWTTSDPLGYPDGWNNFAYCNNRTTSCFDWLGGEKIDSGSYSAYLLFVMNYVANSEDWTPQLNGGNPLVQYDINCSVTKNKTGITVSNINISIVVSQPFSVSYIDENGNVKITLTGISGSAIITSSDINYHSTKNSDGSTTYYADVTVTVSEVVSSQNGTFSQTRTFYKTFSHTVE